MSSNSVSSLRNPTSVHLVPILLVLMALLLTVLGIPPPNHDGNLGAAAPLSPAVRDDESSTRRVVVVTTTIFHTTVTQLTTVTAHPPGRDEGTSSTPEAPQVTTPSPELPSTTTPAASPTTCAERFCSEDREWCLYWAGITSWNLSLGPLPGMTHTIMGPCQTPVASVRKV